jgi:multidrug efflux pump subunit AcrB
MSTKASSDGKKFNLSEWALNQQSLIIFLMLTTIVLGTWSYLRLSRNEDPPFTIKTMVVGAIWPGATTEDTVQYVTDKLEQKLEETPYLDRLDSYTKSGETVIFVNLRDDAPPKEVANVWYQVRKKAADVAPMLPQGVRGPFFDDEFGDTFGIIYGISADGFSDREVRDQLETIRAQLLKTQDVGKVILLGVQEEQIAIEFSPRALALHMLDPSAVMRALQAQNAISPSGVVRTGEEKISLRVSGAFASLESVRNITLRFNGRYVPLSDLANITKVPADPPTPLFRVNGQHSLGIAVSMAATGNLLDFGSAIRQTMTKIRNGLPHGLEITEVADQAAVVKSAVSGFVRVLVEAIAIVLIVSFLSLGFRAGMVVTFSIPLVLALTFVGMDVAGVGLHRVSLGALIIALGLLVDDAMITVEAMVSRLEAGWTIRRAATYAYQSTAFPMLTGTLVMIAGFVPVGFAASSAGEYCFSLFVVILISLLASWIIAVLFSPLIGTWVLPRSPAKQGHQPGRLLRLFQPAMTWLLHHRFVTLGVSLVALALGLFGATRLEEQFFPPSDRPELLVNVSLPQNASFEATDATTKQLEAMLKNDSDVDHFSTYVGMGAIRFYLPMDVLLTNDNISQIVVVAKGAKERDRLKAKIEEAFRQHFPNVAGRAMPLELGPPVGWPLQYRVTGPDVAKVREYAMQVANIVASNPHTRELNLTSGEPQKTVQVQIKQTEARALGFSSEDIASALAALFAGAPVTTLRDGKRLVDVVARAKPGERAEIATLSNLQITSPAGRDVPLTQIAGLSYGVEEPIIWRRDREPIITVQADVTADIQPATVVDQLNPALAKFKSQLPQGYDIQTGGSVEEAAKGSDSVYAVVPVMLALIVSLLMIQLRSFSRTAIALLMAPFGIIGVVAAMLPTHTPMGFVAQLGVLALAGMIIRNAVILIEEVDSNRANGLSPLDSVTEAVKHRTRPIMLTACAAILGMIPIAHQVFWGPMAYAVIGGLAGATVLTLTLLPCAMLWLLGWEERQASKTKPASLSSETTNEVLT